MNQRLHHRRLCRCVRPALLAAAPLLAVHVAAAATITVDTATDANPAAVDGACSLREAIAAAQTNAVVDTCAAGDNSSVTQPDHIVFASALAGDTITLVAALDVDNPAAAGSLVIDGQSQGDGNIVLSGNGASRAITVASGVNLTLNHLVISDGNDSGGVNGAKDGGAISNAGTLALTDVTLRDSTAQSRGGGIFTSGLLTLTDCTLSGNSATGGGAIYASASVALTASTLSGNTASDNGGGINTSADLSLTDVSVADSYTARYGGGIFSRGTLTISGSTLSGNTAGATLGTNLGGALYNGGSLSLAGSTLSDNSAGDCGGALFNAQAGSGATVVASTFSGNASGDVAGAIESRAPLTLTNTTFVDNNATNKAGAVDAMRGTLQIVHSTLAGNTASTGGALYVAATSTATLINSVFANNLDGNCTLATGASFGAASAGNLFYPATDACAGGAVGDPKLGPLRDNGGPTQTMLPGVGSMAVDMVTCAAGVTGDQRDVPRRQVLVSANGPWCDIGAVEVDHIDRDTIFRDGFDP